VVAAGLPTRKGVGGRSWRHPSRVAYRYRVSKRFLSVQRGVSCFRCGGVVGFRTEQRGNAEDVVGPEAAGGVRAEQTFVPNTS